MSTQEIQSLKSLLYSISNNDVKLGIQIMRAQELTPLDVLSAQELDIIIGNQSPRPLRNYKSKLFWEKINPIADWNYKMLRISLSTDTYRVRDKKEFAHFSKLFPSNKIANINKFILDSIPDAFLSGEYKLCKGSVISLPKYIHIDLLKQVESLGGFIPSGAEFRGIVPTFWFDEEGEILCDKINQLRPKEFAKLYHDRSFINPFDYYDIKIS